MIWEVERKEGLLFLDIVIVRFVIFNIFLRINYFVIVDWYVSMVYICDFSWDFF